jgi:hypothetical protein
MAKVKLTGMVERVSGRVGGMVFRWQHGGQTVIKPPDMSKVKWSKAQKAHRQRFKEAVAYAHAALADAKVRAKYEKEAAQKGRRPFELAVSDYFHGKNLLTTDREA